MPATLVLVRTHSPGNLGSCARTAKAFGAALVLVAPSADRAHADARAYASGAEDLLDEAPALDALDAVERDHDLLVAFTSLRGRRERGLPPRTTWAAARRRTGAGDRVALVFGPERSGLTTAELARCSARLTLPTRPGFPTLALPQAAAAALALLSGGRSAPEGSPGAAPAPAREVSRLVEALTAGLLRPGDAGGEGAGTVLHELGSFVRRARPTSREVALLLGALAALRRRPAC